MVALCFFIIFFITFVPPLLLSPAGAAAADGGVGLGEDGGVGGQGVEVGRADHGVTQGPHLGGGGWHGRATNFAWARKI